MTFMNKLPLLLVHSPTTDNFHMEPNFSPSREFFHVYKTWLAVAQEYNISDECSLQMCAQWVFNAQQESAAMKADVSNF
jgi:hypothetical protein